MNTNYDEQARVAALLEKNMVTFADKMTEPGSLQGLGIPGLDEYTVLEKGEAHFPEGSASTLKALVVQDKSGNIYVHFRGTCNGYWKYNRVAYGPVDGKTTSEIQDWALDFFNEAIQKYNPSGEIYVTGHSQGGNNAQFVTMRSEYSDRITACVELDGQGFSHQFVDETRDILGDKEYASRCEKIYAYVGDSDFVSPLGQEHIIPEDHYQVIETTRSGNLGNDFIGFHASDNLTNENGDLNQFGDMSQFRQLILELNQRVVSDVFQDDQERIAEIVMKLVGNVSGGGNYKDPIEQEELQDLKLLVPAILDLLEEDPTLVSEAIQVFDLDPAIVELIETMIGNLNELPLDIREDALNAVIDGIVVTEDGGISFDASKMGWGDALEAAIPVVLETVIHHPEQLLEVLHVTGLDQVILDKLANNKGIVVAAVLVLPFVLPVVGTVASAVLILDALHHIVRMANNVNSQVRDFILKTLNAIKKSIAKLIEWVQAHSSGAKFAVSDPYFKVDTARLRAYANRLTNVNGRLKDLDRALNDVYWQVGLLDVLSILQMNLTVGQSSKLNRAIRYLTDAADAFEGAERKAANLIANGG